MEKREKNKKYRALKDTAYELFMKFGISRVTVEEICLKAGVSKMTFYKYFKNKTHLDKDLIDNLVSVQMEKYRKIMEKPVPFTEKVKLILVLKNEQTEMMGKEFFTDLVLNPNPEIALYLEKIREKSAKEVLESFRSARESGEIRRDIKPEFIIYFLNHLTEMTRDEELLKMYSTPNELAMELTNFFFYGITAPGTPGIQAEDKAAEKEKAVV